MAKQKDLKKLEEDIAEKHTIVSRCVDEVAKVIVGQQSMIEGMLMGLLASGHVLLEGVPGLAKTRAVKALSEVVNVSFNRMQFTPDLLPADLIGTTIYRQDTGEFIPRKGPVFANIILADEINRAPAKVQSALLEAMEEHQVTIGNETYVLAEPFFVLATQNPIEQEGTYPLPEAQLDRFLLKLTVPYPSFNEELQILNLLGNSRSIPLSPILNQKAIIGLRKTAESIRIDHRLEEYIVTIVQATRPENQIGDQDYLRYIQFGASPRASLYFYRCAKIRALLSGRSFTIPEDVKEVAHDLLRHRIVVTYEAESENMSSDDIISALLNHVEVP